VLVAGTTERFTRRRGSTFTTRVLRLTAAGVPDPRFARGRQVRVPGTGRLSNARLTALVPAGDGGVLLALSGFDPRTAHVVRLTRAGALSRRFGARGLARVPAPRSGVAQVAELVRDRRGGLLVVGARVGSFGQSREDTFLGDVRLAVWHYRLR